MNGLQLLSRVGRVVVGVVSVMVICPLLPGTSFAQGAVVSEVGVQPPAMTARLPWTAGELPLLALTGVLCLGASFSLRRLWVR